MALIVPRTAMVDDDGSGTTGTILNNAWKTGLYNDVDVAVTPGIQTTALTGTQSITVTSRTRVLRCMNASLLTLQSLVGGFDGQLITITTNAAGQVDIPDGAGIANGILGGVAPALAISLAPGGASPFNNGRMTIMWDVQIDRWKVLHHEQGAWIPYTPVWGNTGTANTLGNGTVTGSYHLAGRTMRFRLALMWGSTTVAGSAVWTFTFPFPVPAASNGMPFPVFLQDASAAAYGAMGRWFNSSVWVAYSVVGPSAGIFASNPFVWTTSDYLNAQGIAEL